MMQDTNRNAPPLWCPALCLGPATSEGALRTAAALYSHSQIQERLAAHPGLPQDLLEGYLRHPNALVRRRAEANARQRTARGH